MTINQQLSELKSKLIELRREALRINDLASNSTPEKYESAFIYHQLAILTENYNQD